MMDVLCRGAHIRKGRLLRHGARYGNTAAGLIFIEYRLNGLVVKWRPPYVPDCFCSVICNSFNDCLGNSDYKARNCWTIIVVGCLTTFLVSRLTAAGCIMSDE
jgi:hypothetical protein